MLRSSQTAGHLPLTAKTLGLPMWIDLIVECLAGFAFGLFIFQSLFMKSMIGSTYFGKRPKKLCSRIGMNFMMAGMAPVMSFLMMGRDMRAMQPTELLFWGVMSLGVIAGFILAYPSNVWMVARQLKHGLMTERKPVRKTVAVPAGVMAHAHTQLQPKPATDPQEEYAQEPLAMTMGERRGKAIMT